MRQLATLRKGGEAPLASVDADGESGKAVEAVARQMGVSPRQVERAAEVQAKDPAAFEDRRLSYGLF